MKQIAIFFEKGGNATEKAVNDFIKSRTNEAKEKTTDNVNFVVHDIKWLNENEYLGVMLIYSYGL